MAKSSFSVVVVGGGFGGVKAALELAKQTRLNITLISDTEHLRIYPSLYHTATGGSKRVSSVPLAEVFAEYNIDIVYDTAVKLDRETRTITTKSGDNYIYNALVLALGVRTNYFGIEGLPEYSYGIKTLEEAEELKEHLHKQLVDDGHQDLNYIVVGGGPTGVELAGVLPSYVRRIAAWHDLPARKVNVSIIEAAPRLMPRMPKDVSRHVAKQLRRLGVKVFLKTAVKGQTAETLNIDGKLIQSHTVVWTAGMSTNPFFKENEFQMTKNSKVRVDQFLQAEPGIYVLGDNADTPYSGMAQTAIYDGHFIADNIIRLSKKQDPRPYLAKKPVYVMPAGPEWAAVLWGKVRVYGKLGWMLRRAADFQAFKDYEPWKLAMSRWVAEGDREESCPLCADNLSS